MSEIEGGPSEAAVLLMSLLSNVSNIHDDNSSSKNSAASDNVNDINNSKDINANGTISNIQQFKYLQNNNNNSKSNLGNAVSENPFLSLSSSSLPAEAIASNMMTSAKLPSPFSPPKMFTQPYTYPCNLPFAMTPFSQPSALPTSASSQHTIQLPPISAQSSQLPSASAAMFNTSSALPSSNVFSGAVKELQNEQLAAESI